MPTTNLQNRTIFCHDNLEILQGINSNSIDLPLPLVALPKELVLKIGLEKKMLKMNGCRRLKKTISNYIIF